MNGRHVLAPQGAGAIQNPAYRPAGNSLYIEEKSFEISRMRPRARLLMQDCSAIRPCKRDRHCLKLVRFGHRSIEADDLGP
jgi:hypothetical protein